MEALQAKARELLAAGTVKIVIGYGKGTGDSRRPIFVVRPERAQDLLAPRTWPPT